MALVPSSEIEIRMDPRIEALSIAQSLRAPDDADYLSLRETSYLVFVRRMFKRAREHPTPALLERLRLGERAVSLDAATQVRWILHLTYPDFEVHTEPRPDLVSRAGGRDNLVQVARGLQHFVHDSLYSEFRVRNRGLYETAEMDLADALLPWQCLGQVEALVGIRSTYQLLPCLLYPPEPIPVELRRNLDSEFFLVLGPTSFGSEGSVDLQEDRIPELVLLPLVEMLMARYLREEGASLLRISTRVELEEDRLWSDLLRTSLARALLSMVLERRGESRAAGRIALGCGPAERKVGSVVRMVLKAEETEEDDDGLVRALPESADEIVDALADAWGVA